MAARFYDIRARAIARFPGIHARPRMLSSCPVFTDWKNARH
jgi:hypothetical protein